jgi:hypothetical protein
MQFACVFAWAKHTCKKTCNISSTSSPRQLLIKRIQASHLNNLIGHKKNSSPRHKPMRLQHLSSVHQGNSSHLDTQAYMRLSKYFQCQFTKDQNFAKQSKAHILTSTLTV